MSSIKVILYTSKTLKNNEHPIMLRVIKDRKPKYISLKESCSKTLWNTKDNLPKKNHPLYNELVNKINKKKLEASRLILELDNNDKDYSAEQIRFKLKTAVISKKTVFEYFDEIIKRLENSGRIGYANIFQSTKNNFKTFRKDKDLDFIELSATMILKYEEDCYLRNVKMNSVFVYLRTFKTLVNYARKESLIKQEFDPFKDISFTKFRRIKTAKRAISKEDIQKISKLKFENGTSLFNSKNYFLFSYYCRGINFIDMAFLKWENINHGRLTYIRKKTKENFTIEILKPALNILKFYQKKYLPSKLNYVFPILNEKYETAKSIDGRIDRILKTVNSDLKEIAKATKIDIKLTTYVARHSFATNLKKAGISTSVISEALGHESEKTTQIYLESFGNSILDEASKSLL
jgi:site-specific recombinase XerD